MAKQRPITRHPRQHPNSVSASSYSIGCFTRGKKQKLPNEPNFPQDKLLQIMRNASQLAFKKTQKKPKKHLKIALKAPLKAQKPMPLAPLPRQSNHADPPAYKPYSLNRSEMLRHSNYAEWHTCP